MTKTKEKKLLFKAARYFSFSPLVDLLLEINCCHIHSKTCFSVITLLNAQHINKDSYLENNKMSVKHFIVFRKLRRINKLFHYLTNTRTMRRRAPATVRD